MRKRTQDRVTRAHAWVYRRTAGRVGRRLLGMEQVLLTTTGRASGLPRTTPLSAFPVDERGGVGGVARRSAAGRGGGAGRGRGSGRAGGAGGAVVLVASDGGGRDHPHWYRNLRVHPLVTVQRGPARISMSARTATAAERDRWWPQVAAVYPGYERYQAATAREIPLVLCEPLP